MRGFKRVVTILAIVVVLGGGSLGVGFGAGYAIGRRYNEAMASPAQPTTNISPFTTVAAGEESNAFAFADLQPEILPIEVHVSNITEVVRNASPAVVSIHFNTRRRNLFGAYPPGSGSGVIFAEDENFIYIATNNHVVYGMQNLTISLDDYTRVEATMVNGDRASDLAIVSVSRDALVDKHFTIATFGDSDLMQVGDEVVALGNALGDGQTATYGIISATGREITVDGLTLRVLQTDAAINPGNSGGALVNMRSEVIGINVAKAIAANVEGMGYAIPSNVALEILNFLLEDHTAPQPFLGVYSATITEADRANFNLPSLGVLIRGVEEGSPAYSAGLRVNDLLVGFNNKTIESTQDLQAALAESTVGERVQLHIYRRGYRITLTAIIGNRNAH